jgi:deoxyribodipyrimidine photo-lyase
MPTQKRAIYWFRNDLRLHDHEFFSVQADKFDVLLPVYCFDPRQFIQHPLGFKRTGPFRARFLMESLQDLRQSLGARGSGLYVAVAKPEEEIPRLARAMDAQVVFAEKEVTAEEIAVEDCLIQSLQIPLQTFWGRSLIHPDDLPFALGELPDVFTSFRKAVEAGAGIRVRQPVSTPASLPPLPNNIVETPLPTLEELGLAAPVNDARAVLAFKGGEQAGLDRLAEYFWRRRAISHYKDTRNGLLGEDFSSKFSPWLACGTLSPRLIYEEVQRFEQEVVANESTYWLIFELLWRDYFRFVAWKYGSRIFKKGGIKEKSGQFENGKERFLRWCQGETGEPFVDANMKELAATGYMSNRGRQNVASFLCHELEVDWRWGAAWFESLLIDYDVCSNQGNWMYVAGVGNDPRPNRRFNIRRQAQRYDPDGAYVRHWLQ